MPKSEITLPSGWSPLNLLHTFRSPFLKNTWMAASEKRNNYLTNRVLIPDIVDNYLNK